MVPSTPTCATEEQFLTSQEVMARLLQNRALLTRVATCVLPAVRVGMEWRFRLSDLEAWIAAQS